MTSAVEYEKVEEFGAVNVNEELKNANCAYDRGYQCGVAELLKSVEFIPMEPTVADRPVDPTRGIDNPHVCATTLILKNEIVDLYTS